MFLRYSKTKLLIRKISILYYVIGKCSFIQLQLLEDEFFVEFINWLISAETSVYTNYTTIVVYQKNGLIDRLKAK